MSNPVPLRRLALSPYLGLLKHTQPWVLPKESKTVVGANGFSGRYAYML